MTILPPFLAARGARLDAEDVLRFGEPTAQWRAARSDAVVTDASSVGRLVFEGPDTADFLQGQLSNDVKALAPGQGQWTTYNSPKGRMLATLFLTRDVDGDRYVAVLASELVEPIRKRLTMFVLRAKVRIAGTPPGTSIFGIGGPAARDAVVNAFGEAPAAAHVAAHGDIGIEHWPDGRFLVAAGEASAGRAFDALAAHATPADAPVWAWLGVRAGVPMITAATQDLFVAQTANWDALGGLDFRKGCFTGQEIVARTQHLGRLKERLFAFRTETGPPAPATRLYGEPFGDQACGTVVNSAPDPEGGSRFLAVAQIQAADAGPMSIGSPDGPAAEREPLPYDLPDPSPPRGRIGR